MGSALFAGGITVVGGDNGDGSDTLDYTAVAAGGVVTVDYDLETITQGASSTSFAGIEHIILDANGNAVDINGTPDDDAFTVRPNDATGALVELAGNNTRVQVSNTLDLEIDGEMMADTAWDAELRQRIFPNTTLTGRANLFVMPNLDAANITYNMIRVMTDGVAIGPILMGLDKPAHILTPASTPRRVVNMTAIAAVDAQIRAARDAGERRG